MNINSCISVLHKECEARNFTWHDGFKINVSSNINIEKDEILHTFSVSYDTAQTLIYIAGLTVSCHDNYEFKKNNPTLPILDFKYAHNQVGIPERTKELIAAVNEVKKLDKCDKKENRKVQAAKTVVLSELTGDIKYSLNLGTGFRGDGHKFPSFVITNIEQQLNDYIATLKKWKQDQTDKARKDNELMEQYQKTLKKNCISFLIMRGFTPSVLESIDANVLRKQVEQIAIDEYVKQTGFKSNVKEYDDDGRFTYYLECCYDASSKVNYGFYVVERKDYY